MFTVEKSLWHGTVPNRDFFATKLNNGYFPVSNLDEVT